METVLFKKNIKLIAHRGNIDGKNSSEENTPSYLNEAVKRGYDVEVDVWYVDDKLFLGHDGPQYETTLQYLRNESFWCHCKNIAALRLLLDNNIHCFFHKSDDVSLTSRGYIWTFPKKKLVENSICVMPEYGYSGDLNKCYAICGDFVGDYR